MPKGIPKKKELGEVQPAVADRPLDDAQGRPTSPALPSKSPKLEALGPGQAYYEAPDGTIIIGDAGKDRIWYRAGNGGKGMWINPKR